ncbi:hypothetical protein Tco_1351738 [Tanacetum coccineum]
MEDPNLTMEEYIDLEAEKARRHDFPAIVFDDPLATDHKISSEPTVSPLDDNEIDFKISFDESDDEDYTFIYDKNSFSYKLISINDLKLDLENDDNKVNISSDDVFVEQSDNGIDTNVDAQYHEFDEDFETNHDIHSESVIMKDYFIIIKVMIQKLFHKGMPLIFIIKNLYVPFGIPFDPKHIYKDGAYTNSCGGQDMTPPLRDHRHLWLRYEGQEYTDADIVDFKGRLEKIYDRQVHRVQALEFDTLIEEMRGAMVDRLRMEHTDAQGKVVFTSHAWRRLFEIRGPLVHELILEFFNTFRIPKGVFVLDTAGTLQFQLTGLDAV